MSPGRVCERQRCVGVCQAARPLSAAALAHLQQRDAAERVTSGSCLCSCGIRGEMLRLTAPLEGPDSTHTPEAFMEPQQEERLRERPACGASFSQHIPRRKQGLLKLER